MKVGTQRVVGLYAGIGGFELAFERCGFTTLALAEIDPAARSVLKSKFPHAELFGDVREIEYLPSETNIVTAGFPCQNLSMAGDKKGIEGTKSGEVSVLFDLLRGFRAPVVVVENVYFMLHLGRGTAMSWLMERFEALGYKWAYRVLNTLSFGLPHRRRRVYLVASLELDPRTVLFADENGPRTAEIVTLERPLGFYWTEGRTGVGLTVDGIPPLKAGSNLGIPSAPAVLFPDGEVLMPNVAACEQLQGFPGGWTQGSFTGGRDPRWRLIGNAVSVPAAKWVASRIMQPGDILPLETLPMRDGDLWPHAAFNVGRGRFSVQASSQPIVCSPTSISNYRDSSWKSISDRGLTGFLSRAKKGNLRFPDGFLDALESNLVERHLT